MDLRLLQYFMKVCEVLSFTRAAEELGITQPTLSHQIRLLESRVHAQLFERAGKKIYRTQAGEVLLLHARRIFDEVDQTQQQLQELQGLSRGKLAIGCSGTHILIAPTTAFHAQYPAIELSIMDMRTEKILEGLLANRLDLGIVFMAKPITPLIFTRLFDEEFYLVVSKEHAIASWHHIAWADLASIPLALLPGQYRVRQFIDEYCHEAGITVTPPLQFTSLDSLQNILQVKTIATILTKSYLPYLTNPDLTIIPLIEPAARKPVGLAYRPTKIQDTTTRTFINLVKKHFAQWN